MKSYDEMIRERRMMLKAHGIEREEWGSHQRKGIPPLPLEKPYPKDGTLVSLVQTDSISLGSITLAEAITQRQSHRKFTGDALTLEELSFLLWSTQGVKSVDENNVWTKRTVPSGGARHPFETYLVMNRVEAIESGVYRYLPIEHKLSLWRRAINSFPIGFQLHAMDRRPSVNLQSSSCGQQFPIVTNGATV